MRKELRYLLLEDLGPQLLELGLPRRLPYGILLKSRRRKE